MQIAYEGENMNTRNKAITSTLLVVSILVIGIGSSNAASPAPIGSSSLSGLTSGQIKPQSIAADGGGSSSSSSGSASDILAEIAAAARAAGGWSILGKTVQCIYNTARMCPQCFAL
jgi:hypothetical protein